MVEGQKTHYIGMFTKVKPIRGFEDVVAQIQDAIVSGQIKTGDQLPSERDLANLFNVSRTTVREAIRVLEAEQVVEVKRGVNGGVFIIEPKPDQVGRSLESLIRFRGATTEDLAEFRSDFEVRMAYLAAQRATEEEIAELTEIADRLNQLSEDTRTTWAELVAIDLSFHEKIASASHNQIYVAIILGIHNVLRRTSLSIERKASAEWRKQQAVDVRNIVSAIRDKDPERARKAMEEHILKNINLVKEG